MFTLGVMVMLTLVEIRGSVGHISEPDVSFPPARPSLANLHALCTQGSGRPRYTSSVFAKSVPGHQRRRGSAVNRVEAWYSRCCAPGQAQEQALCCATQAWEYALNVFCNDEYGVKDMPHKCCEQWEESRLTCFQSEAPNPAYLPTPGYTAPSIAVNLRFTWDPSTC
ncbi:extracellular matrix protein 1-like [Alosa alosa]|uniref:extracellular matrix protein 1-like n=1 Tax=Alosa alosa TaxID=278164 RepID=UPI0020150D14|nr:extracellular matrix protein 1-like [Alosa alosa]